MQTTFGARPRSEVPPSAPRRAFAGAAARALALALALASLAPRIARGHCDTLDGPVVSDARNALAKGDVTPALRWVGEGDEGAIREAFAKTIAVRGTGPEARELADVWFFETLVRIHRAGEGAPYSGLKPAGTEAAAGIAMADRALSSGSGDALVAEMSAAIAAGIRARLERAIELQKHADESVLAGRAYVAAYVDFIHFVERLETDAAATGPHGEHGDPAEEGGGHTGHH